jgi:uncharacterized membrane protein YuzA (DUF378 family)
MFRRKPSLGDRIADGADGLRAGASSAAQRVSDRRPSKLDSAAAGTLLLGMANWFAVSLLNFDAVQAAAGKKSMPARAAYGVLGLSAVYAALRGARKAT